MKVGIIGNGTMGKNHARIYSEIKNIDDIYVFDVDKNKTSEMEKLGFTLCGSVEELLDNVSAVSICVPTRYHLDVAKKVIERDIHCLIEKPVTMSAKEGDELLNIIRDKDVIVGVGHIERFNPIINEIKKMIVNPFYIDIRRHNPSSSRISDTSVIEDLMIHDIDIVFNTLFNMKNYDIYSSGNEDVCKTVITSDDSTISISASRKACKKIRTIYIEDEKFTIEGDFMSQEIYAYWRPEKYGIDKGKYVQENIIEKVSVNKIEPLRIELRTFIDCIKKNMEFPITVEQALCNLRICEKIKTNQKKVGI